MRCEHCGGELVEVDNPMRREFRHRRGVVCPGGRPEDAPTPTDYSAETPLTDPKLAQIRKDAHLMVNGHLVKKLADEVDRLRAEAVQHAEDRDAYVSKAIDRYNALAEETRRLRDEVATLDKGMNELDRENARLRAENAQAWSEGHAAAMAAMLDEKDALAAKLDAARSTNSMLTMQIIAARDCVASAHREVEDDLPRTIEALNMAVQALEPIEPSEDLRRRWESATTPPAPESPRPPAEEGVMSAEQEAASAIEAQHQAMVQAGDNRVGMFCDCRTWVRDVPAGLDAMPRLEQAHREHVAEMVARGTRPPSALHDQSDEHTSPVPEEG